MKKFYQSAPAQAFIAWAAARYLTLAARTLRWRVEGEANLRLMAGDTPLIVVFWHECLPAMPIFWLRAKRLGMSRPAVVLASQHRDGQLIGRAVQHMGIALVSGSSSRGGAAGLRGLLKALDNGMHVGLTPDGPRGPRRTAAPGAAQLAGLSGVQILPCGAVTSRAKTLDSWDKMRLPLPFGRGALVCGAPVSVSREDWQAGVPAIASALNAVMARAAELL
ncbi:lysophospholipid acyltransferase family protein [Acidocella sp.]|uniref:lysophospholipid acyltransferase family protein n=1 Tax=Acidocella sp. TaxID=50710 RepID=UPI002601B6E1|nr:lysophospholipid acyltransferase family protein [Acidocella sp.]MDD2795745.1 lysophospholipid acyltransferase family protein [Acidocella sp.]